MLNYLNEQEVFNGDAVPAAAFTAATTDIITSNGHGLQTDDLVQLTTSDTLPAGLAVTTDYYVIEPTTNTFKLAATPGGTAVDVTDTGTGTHTYHLKGKAILTKGYRHLFLSFNTSDSANFTMKVQGSYADDMPDFNAAQSKSNRWDYIEIKDIEDLSSIDGDTGIAPAGTDDQRMFLINSDGLTWCTVVITSWTAGKLRAGLTLSNG